MVERQRRDAQSPPAMPGLALPQRGVERVGADPAGRRVHLGGQHPQTQHRFAVVAAESTASISVMWPSVNVPVLSVIKMSMSPRSSMHTSRFTRTLSRASRRDPDARLVLTTAGSNCGVMPTAMASAEQHGLDHRPTQQQVDDDDEHGQRQRHPQEQVREPAQPHLEVGFRLTLTQPGGDPAELGVGAGGVDHRGRITGADDRAHEREVGCVGQRRRRPVPAAADFSVAVDSPVRMLSLHSSPLTSISRTSAGTSSPSSRRMTSPGTSVLTSTWSGGRRVAPRRCGGRASAMLRWRARRGTR